MCRYIQYVFASQIIWNYKAIIQVFITYLNVFSMISQYHAQTNDYGLRKFMEKPLQTSSYLGKKFQCRGCKRKIKLDLKERKNIQQNLKSRSTTKWVAGNALARVQRMHKPVRLWDILHPQISRLLVLLKPADFEAQSSFLQNRMHLQIQIPNACPESISANILSLSIISKVYGKNCTHSVNPKL